MSYKIVVLRQAYSPDLQGIERPHFLSEENSQDDLVIDTIEDAKDKIEELDNEIYVTSNGESGRPEYLIVDDNYTIGYDDMSNYNWDDSDCDRGADGEACGECADCIQLMINQDRQGVINNKVEAE